MTGRLDEKLTKKIIGSDLFIVLGTRYYIISLKEADESISTQIDIARKLKKPFFMIIDRNLSKEDRKYLDEYFSKDNIISRMEVDIGNRASVVYIAEEIKKLMRELRITEDYKGVIIDTPYDDDE
jgi:hypothetical protein